jgi:anti-sigma B factor antagonist
VFAEGELDVEEPVAIGTLRLSSRRRNGTATVIVVGELDIATADQLLAYVQKVLDLAPRQLILDMTGVSFIAAAGLGVLAVLAGSAAGYGAEFLLGEVSPAVARLLKVAGMAERYPSAAVSI